MVGRKTGLKPWVFSCLENQGSRHPIRFSYFEQCRIRDSRGFGGSVGFAVPHMEAEHATRVYFSCGLWNFTKITVENWKAKNGTGGGFFILKATGQYLEVADFGMARVAREIMPFLAFFSVPSLSCRPGSFGGSARGEFVVKSYRNSLCQHGDKMIWFITKLGIFSKGPKVYTVSCLFDKPGAL